MALLFCFCSWASPPMQDVPQFSRILPSFSKKARIQNTQRSTALGGKLTIITRQAETQLSPSTPVIRNLKEAIALSLQVSSLNMRFGALVEEIVNSIVQETVTPISDFHFYQKCIIEYYEELLKNQFFLSQEDNHNNSALVLFTVILHTIVKKYESLSQQDIVFDEEEKQKILKEHVLKIKNIIQSKQAEAPPMALDSVNVLYNLIEDKKFILTNHALTLYNLAKVFLHKKQKIFRNSAALRIDIVFMSIKPETE
ncbi:MAG: hypothetical protein K2X39_10265, partial [Silvanigrellaceae bacterium]|nr:hypothetical protein [Silvanigrellaceae bacterium]